MSCGKGFGRLARLLIAALALSGCIAVPAAAGEGVYDWRTMIKQGSPDRTSWVVMAKDLNQGLIDNDIEIGFDGTTFAITDQEAGVVGDWPCVEATASTAHCPLTGPLWSLRVGTYRGDDFVDASAPALAGLEFGVVFDLGTGGDVYVGGPAADQGNGGPGADTIRAGAGDDKLDCCKVGDTGGDDRLVGGPGDDEIFAWRGADVAIGGPGNDRLEGFRDGNTRDRLDCGPGRDVVWPGPNDVVGANCERLAEVLGCAPGPKRCVTSFKLILRPAGKAAAPVVIAKRRVVHRKDGTVSVPLAQRALRRELARHGRAKLTRRIVHRKGGRIFRLHHPVIVAAKPRP